MSGNQPPINSPEIRRLSPVLQEMRADFHQFPPFEGGNVHYVLETRMVSPR